MRRPVQLLTVKDIAAIAGVSPTRAHALVNKPDFPEPFATSGLGRLWLPDEVKTWVATWEEQKEERKRKARA